MDEDRIMEALALLDPENDDHWTTTGLPRMDALEIAYSTLLEDPLAEPDIKRRQVELAVPDYDRDVARTNRAAADAAAKPEGTQDEGTGTSGEDENGGASDETESKEGLSDEEGTKELPDEDPPAPDPLTETDPLTEPGLRSSPRPELELSPQEVVTEELNSEAFEKEELRVKLVAQLEEVQERRAAAVKARDEANTVIDRLDKEATKITNKLDGEVGAIPLSKALRHAADSSHRERMRRAGIVATINRNSGMETGLTSAAPIDAASKRSRKRGSKRVVRKPIQRGMTA